MWRERACGGKMRRERKCTWRNGGGDIGNGGGIRRLAGVMSEACDVAANRKTISGNNKHAAGRRGVVATTSL